MNNTVLSDASGADIKIFQKFFELESRAMSCLLYYIYTMCLYVCTIYLSFNTIFSLLHTSYVLLVLYILHLQYITSVLHIDAIYIINKVVARTSANI